MNFTVLIPARLASTRLPNKPLADIGGAPMVVRVAQRVARAQGIDEMAVATDDERIARAVTQAGFRAVMTDPACRNGTERIAQAARELKADGYLNVQGDEPLIDPALISRLAKTLTADKTIEMITAANEFGSDEDAGNPNAVKVVLDRADNALYFSRSVIPFPRDGSPRYLRHQGIYGYSAKFLLQFVKWKPGALEQCEQLEQLRALENGSRIRVLLTKSASIGVDAPEDAALVEHMLSS